MTPADGGAAGDWIEWSGGECPVAKSVIVDVRHADGKESHRVKAGDAADDCPRAGFDWWKHTDTQPKNEHGFIIAYRVVQP